MGVELRQISAAGLAVEYGHNFHRGLFLRNVGVAGTAVANNANVLVKLSWRAGELMELKENV